MNLPRIAIMQGRLSPAGGSRLQFFPADWQAEFPLAKKLGFSGITWFLDQSTPGFDPVRDVWGSAAALEDVDRARAVLPIHSIDCGLYPLFGADKERTVESFRILLPGLAGRLASSVVVVPLLVHTAPRTEEEKREARESVGKIAAVAAPLGLRLALETEMPADELADFVDSFGSPAVGVCYDIGSCTAYGFDCPADIERLGSRILEVHLKDHKRTHIIGKDRSVPLGEGDADFAGCFRSLNAIGYKGGYTMQAWRGENYLADAATQLGYITNLMQAL